MTTEPTDAVSMPTASGTAAATLRAATARDHEIVDGAYARFALTTQEGYRDFLTAHARILPLAERAIRPGELLEAWTPRAPALLADLAELGGDAPPEIAFSLPAGIAARWGAVYVLEGSRLGGAFLAKTVPEGLPRAYLGARHAPGAWRHLLDTLNYADTGPQWREEALGGARALFGAFREAAARRLGQG